MRAKGTTTRYQLYQKKRREKSGFGLWKKCIILLPLFYAVTTKAQDLEQIAKAKWFSVNGGASLNGSSYSSYGLQSRRDPFVYNIAANLNFNFKGVVDAPFSLFMTSQNKTFNAPAFNIIGISPRYKWITAHIGARNIEMSQFTYTGTTFTGGGIELMPENFIVKGKAFYGRLVKAVPVGDTLSSFIQVPVYERWGGGGMITVGTQNHSVDFILFKGKDLENSLNITDSSNQVKPEENLVLGLNTRHRIESFLFVAEYAFSAYTRDTRQGNTQYDKYTYMDNFGSFFRPKASSFYASAWNLSTDYQAEKFTVGLSFQQIDPNYQTMGALFMLNDVQNILSNASVQLLENKMNLSGSFGFQRNNLSGKSEAVDKRFISSFNISYAILENLSTSLNYSNFNTSTEAVRILVFDSIKYAQINNNLSFNAAYSIANEQLNHSFDFSLIFQNANTINNEFTSIESTNNQMNGLSMGYRLGFVQSDFGIAVNASANRNKMNSVDDFTGGPGISFNKGFFKKKLQAILGFSSMFSKSESSAVNVNMTRLALNYRFWKKHSLNFNSSYMSRGISNPNQDQKKSGEFIGSLTYNFAF